MFGIDAPTLAIVAAYSALLTVAGIADAAKRRIPNWTVVGIILLFAAWVFARPGTSVPSALGAFTIALLFSAGLYLIRWVGAGDSKLFSAVALFAGLTLLPTLSIATVLIGAALVLASVIFNPRRAGRGLTARGRAELRGVPYGVAIALAGLLIMFAPGFGLLQARDELGLLPIGSLAPSQR